MPEPEREAPELDLDYGGGRLWDQLQRLAGNTKISLLIQFADLEDTEGEEYDTNPYTGR